VQSENFLLVAISAEKFGCRPSRMVGLDDAVVALDLDLAAAARLLERERRSLAASDAVDASGSGERAAREEKW